MSEVGMLDKKLTSKEIHLKSSGREKFPIFSIKSNEISKKWSKLKKCLNDVNECVRFGKSYQNKRK